MKITEPNKLGKSTFLIGSAFFIFAVFVSSYSQAMKKMYWGTDGSHFYVKNLSGTTFGSSGSDEFYLYWKMDLAAHDGEIELRRVEAVGGAGRDPGLEQRKLQEFTAVQRKVFNLTAGDHTVNAVPLEVQERGGGRGIHAELERRQRQLELN